MIFLGEKLESDQPAHYKVKPVLEEGSYNLVYNGVIQKEIDKVRESGGFVPLDEEATIEEEGDDI
ncbi:hypothetical protein HDU76_005693 [Blyttiomyces sp. JEL0837]|nr:hypothetical protein HDU76_005693 [Blyttiomyces sp. JEL0837]